jgi:hypothetical protein
MVLIATFNNISALSWQSVLLEEETTDLPQITDKLKSHVACIHDKITDKLNHM